MWSQPAHSHPLSITLKQVKKQNQPNRPSPILWSGKESQAADIAPGGTFRQATNHVSDKPAMRFARISHFSMIFFFFSFNLFSHFEKRDIHLDLPSLVAGLPPA